MVNALPNMHLCNKKKGKSHIKDTKEIDSKENQAGNIDYIPLTCDLVALVAKNSKESVPKVFVAKVLR